MRRSLVLFSSILLSCLRVRAADSRLDGDIADRRARPSFDLHRNRDHPVSALGVLGGLLHHLAVARSLSHEVAARYQLGAPEFSGHAKNPPSDGPRSSRLKAIAMRRIRLCGAAWPQGTGARPGGSRPVLGPSGAPDQAALTSIVVGIAAPGWGLPPSRQRVPYF